jgi:hypothetical protein
MSRRLFLRRTKREYKKKVNKQLTIDSQKMNNKTKHNLIAYGFQAIPNTNLQNNFNEAIKKPTSALFQQPTNLAFHNLCSSNALPTGSRELLGLNLKFCIASRNLPYNLNKAMLKRAYSIRTR